MQCLNDTPKANRIHIAFFGLRNAGKSTLVNAFTGQNIAIVSDVAGTTTDPVSKAMEILPLGPCLVTDTAGLDDIGELGEMRVKKSFSVLASSDIAVWVCGDDCEKDSKDTAEFKKFKSECERYGVSVLEYARNENIEEFKKRVASVEISEQPKPLVGDMVASGDTVLLVCPQDGSAPKGRLILPQQQVIREILDAGAAALVCQVETAAKIVENKVPCRFAIVDSQVFGKVASILPDEIPLTSFSVLFARAKGDLSVYCAGLQALENLQDGDIVLVAEGCAHHRQCGDIGTVKIPRAIGKITGKDLQFKFCSGTDFPFGEYKPKLVVQCGGCMLTRREMLRRISVVQAAGVPITNYGLVLAAANGIEVDHETCMAKVSGQKVQT
ncbi:MAG: 50S ribosome-binding GTPase [Kiritimatiellae bacterium]|nr:50S ribosome-binding GTPase [Kiritimatiellia bacterium]